MIFEFAPIMDHTGTSFDLGFYANNLTLGLATFNSATALIESFYISMSSLGIQEFGEIILAIFIDVVVQGYINEMPMPGVKCPRCAERGIDQWVLPGKHCPRCNQPC